MEDSRKRVTAARRQRIEAEYADLRARDPELYRRCVQAAEGVVLNRDRQLARLSQHERSGLAADIEAALVDVALTALRRRDAAPVALDVGDSAASDEAAAQLATWLTGTHRDLDAANEEIARLRRRVGELEIEENLRREHATAESARSREASEILCEVLEVAAPARDYLARDRVSQSLERKFRERRSWLIGLDGAALRVLLGGAVAAIDICPVQADGRPRREDVKAILRRALTAAGWILVAPIGGAVRYRDG